MKRKFTGEIREEFGISMVKIMIIFSLLIFFSSFAWGGEAPYPSKAINIVIPMTPGGVTDTLARIIGDRLGEVLGQSIIRVHKPGGGGVLAGSFVAKAKPDGYTLFMGTSTNIVLAPVLKKANYTLQDFIPLGIFSRGAVYLYVKADSKWKTLQEFVEEAKREPLKVSSFGKQTHAEFVIETFSRRAGIKLAHVPFKSCSEAATALLGGHVEADFCTSAMGQVESGIFRQLAIADYGRSKLFPEVKTFMEQGYSVALPLWYSFCVPSKTPKEVVDILANAMQEVFKRYSKEIEIELKRMEYSPDFLGFQQSNQEFEKDFETTLKIAKELELVSK